MAAEGSAGGGNWFQRQKELKGWSQPSIENLHAFVLGAGGLGTTISMDLCRLGVRKITLLDYDVVDDHNLNRQILYTKEHVGKLKVECAKTVLEASHNLRSEIAIVNTDAVKNWGEVVALTKGTRAADGSEVPADKADPVDIIFNSIDYGDAFDAAVSSMALALDIPVILGGTEPWYGHTVSFFFQEQRSREGNGPCFACAHDSDSVKPEQLATLHPDKILGLTDISYLPKDVYPDEGGSTVYSAGTCSHIMVAQMMSYLLRCADVDTVVAGDKAAGKEPTPYSSEDASPHRVPPKNTVILNMIAFECSGWRTERNAECKVCIGYHPTWEAALPPKPEAESKVAEATTDAAAEAAPAEDAPAEE